VLSLFALALVACLPGLAHAQGNGNKADIGPVEISGPVQQDVSPPLRDLPKGVRAPGNKETPMKLIPRGQTVHQNDPVVQGSAGPKVGTTGGLNFAGVGNGDYGFVPNAAPPDTNGAVGATQYVQWVNESFAVFDKTTGAIASGFPKAGNSLWSGFGGGCETNNDGDPVVQYDKAANRWVMTQFSVSTTPYLQCVAVSQTSDATGAYYRYAFTEPYFNDYPKLGVWPDGYYISFNMFNGNSFVGGRACALNRSAMLTGATALQICFQLSPLYGGLLPSDLDGATPPPSGSPNFFLSFGNDSASMDLWKFHADFVTPANSTLTHVNFPVAAFALPCSGGGACIPQSGTSQKLDSLGDRLMHRVAYRNFGDHEALVANHSVSAGSSVGVRWYEIRNPNSAPAVFQQGTYAPDSSNRWMGSIAMDKVGNIALGYSVSSSSMFPGIRYTGRAPGDALGTLQTENTIISGGGSQTSGLNRWGDYSAMTIDPSDDCTFFSTNEYLKSSGSFNWSTQIASFKFPTCTSVTQVLTSITVSPAAASVQVGKTQQFAATALDQNGNPMSSQPAFTWGVSGGGTISSSGLFTATTVGGAFSVTASSGGINGTASVTVTAVPSDFSLSLSPSSRTVSRGGTATYTVTISPLNGFNGPVTLSLSGQPSGSTVTFNPNPATTTSNLTVKTSSSSQRGTYTLTVKGTSGSLTHTATASLTVTR
jgi:hypothetical protein